MRIPTGEQNVLLILCDISGYTRFMVANKHARMHTYAVITELIRAILKSVREPVRVSKLEGDAVFLYLTLPGGDVELNQRAGSILALLDSIFRAFETRLAELEESNICPCEACANVSQLQLKIIVHYGVALLHNIGAFSELSGIDVILAHRLLKNSVERERYVLITEPARSLVPDDQDNGIESQESYDDLGTIKTFVYSPLLSASTLPEPQKPRRYATLFHQVKNDLLKIYHSRLMALRLKRPLQLHHLPEA
jgi:class 3 adenylate cyclase